MTARPPPFLGHDGLITLLAALLVAALTLGLAPLVATLAVRRTAKASPLRPAAEPARIVVLGHRLEAGGPSGEYVARLARALDLAGHYPSATVALLGGATSPGAPTEAEVGRAWLLGQGLDPARITTETRSRHTLENLRNHRDARPDSAPEALVTSRLHLHRALLMAHGLGLEPMPIAAEEALRPGLARLCAEGFMVHWYRTGRVLARLLRRRRWLARIG